MRIVRWAESDIPDLGRYGVQEIITEIDADGRVLREIGLDPSGGVTYTAPTRKGVRPYGFFDGLVIEVSSLGSAVSDVSSDQFEALWAEGR